MTAIVAAAAVALDLTGDLLTADAAPCDGGVLFLPEPIYHRRPTGTVAAIGAITWTSMSAPSGRFWLICAWSPRDDPDDPEAARIRRDLAGSPALRSSLGPYLLADVKYLPIAQPVPAPPETEPVDEASLDWQSAPDGRYVITDTDARIQVVAAITYAFWRIQAQPIAVAAPTPVDRAARRRAARASVVHTTRVVTLRRTSPVVDCGDGEAKWHYRVRFIVRGHWRRLVDKQGNPYRIWIHAHIRSVDRTTGVSCRHAALVRSRLTRDVVRRGGCDGTGFDRSPRCGGARGRPDRQRSAYRRRDGAMGCRGWCGYPGRPGERVLARPSRLRFESGVVPFVRL